MNRADGVNLSPGCAMGVRRITSDVSVPVTAIPMQTALPIQRRSLYHSLIKPASAIPKMIDRNVVI